MPIMNEPVHKTWSCGRFRWDNLNKLLDISEGRDTNVFPFSLFCRYSNHFLLWVFLHLVYFCGWYKNSVIILSLLSILLNTVYALLLVPVVCHFNMGYTFNNLLYSLSYLISRIDSSGENFILTDWIFLFSCTVSQTFISKC